MLIGFFIGAFIGSLFDVAWMPLFLGCLGALIALIDKWERELAPYKERERRRQLKRRGDVRRAAQKIRNRTIASSTVARQWQDDDDTAHDFSEIGLLGLSIAAIDDEPMMQINPATGLPMLNNCVDVGGNLFGCSDDWTDNFSDNYDDSFSSFDDSFSSSSDDW